MVEKFVLDNGIEVICDKLDFFQTFSMGFWVRIGSIFESESTNGYTHLLEHMLFKGTEKRNYLDISIEIDQVGGYINAFTEQENTCFYVNLTKEYLNLGVDILSDMITNSKLDENELEKEKQVAIEELKMYEDSPDELISDLFYKNLWKNHPLGRPIIGNISNIQNATRDKLTYFLKNFYTSNNLVISISGNFDQKQLLKELESIPFSTGKKNCYPQEPLVANLKSGHHVKDLEQVYFHFGFQALNRHHPKRYVGSLLNLILGGGSSSRLFLEIREKLGLCYSIYSFYRLFEDNGVLAVGSSTSVDNYKSVLQVTMNEIEKLNKHGITGEELNRAKEQVKGNIIFGQENLESRMNRNAKSYIYYNRTLSKEEIFAEIDKITVTDVNDLINDTLHLDNYSFFSLGPDEHIPMFPSPESTK